MVHSKPPPAYIELISCAPIITKITTAITQSILNKYFSHKLLLGHL